MNIEQMLSQAGNLTRPGTRDQIPAASVVLLAWALIAAGAPRSRVSGEQLFDRIGQLTGTDLALLLLSLVAASLFLTPLLSSVASVLRGEPRSALLGRLSRQLFRGLHRRRVEFYLRRMAELNREVGQLSSEPNGDASSMVSVAAAEAAPPDRVKDQMDLLGERLRRYPSFPERVQATELGNALAAAEERAETKYGLDTVVTLPRLEPLLPDRTAQLLAARRDDLEFWVRLSSALVIAALLSAVLLIPPIFSDWGNNWGWLSIPIAAFVLAWSSYRSGVAAAIRYGEAMAIAFDLHRFRLYTEMRLPQPKNLAEERQRCMSLSAALWGDYIAPETSYVHPTGGSPKEDAVEGQ
jgi:hypothetical protein